MPGDLNGPLVEILLERLRKRQFLAAPVSLFLIAKDQFLAKARGFALLLREVLKFAVAEFQPQPLPFRSVEVVVDISVAAFSFW